MSFQKKVMQTFLAEQESHYIGKYRYHSGYQEAENLFKVRYYMLDQNFRQIDIYVEIHCQDRLTSVFSEDLHEQEQLYIVKDAVARILKKQEYKSTLHYSLYESYVKTNQPQLIGLEPIDLSHLLEYMKYHLGIQQKTMDDYYQIFIPCMKFHFQNRQYKQFVDSVNLLLDHILYHYEWNGTDDKYLDTEYQYHIYYVRKIIRIVYKNLDKFYKHAAEELFESIRILCLHQRFSFAIMTDFGSMVLLQHKVANEIMQTLSTTLVLNEKEREKENVNLVFSYIYYIFINDFEQYYAVVLKVLRAHIDRMLTFANHDLDLALGNAVVQGEGYQVLLDLFHEDYNTYIFSCFPIASFPQELRPKVRDDLVTAIQYFAARMESENYRTSSFEQVMNINRILMDNFKEWYK